MNIASFIHFDATSTTTLAEIKRIHALVTPTQFFGIYAYATRSGAASFDLEFGNDFWENTPTKWLLGIDYGRTEPQALRHICSKANAEVRIVDGAWVTEQKGFVPRRDFHAKLSLMSNPAQTRFGMIVGSGNFSSNGLRKNIEAGATIYIDNDNEYLGSISATADAANALWEGATDATEMLDLYEERWLGSFSRNIQNDIKEGQELLPQKDLFWIEAGYVTRNRGQFRPGNQIDFPRGMSRYFGFNPDENLEIKSIIGEVKFYTPSGDSITRNLRLGNNHMEKISLPTPEAHGFDIYDGKVLVFRRSADGFYLNALEIADFEAAFGDQLSSVRVMGSGRRYGHID